MGQSTSLPMSGAAALFAVLAQSFDTQDSIGGPSPGRRLEHLIEVLKSDPQKTSEDDAAIRTLSLARRYFYMAERYPD